MKNCAPAVAALLLCLLLPCLGWAEPTYVSDIMEITLRAGPSNGHKVIAMLTSAQPVEVAETREGWGRVKVLAGEGAGRAGWVLSRLLMTRLPWKAQYEAMRTVNEDIKDRYANFDQRWRELAQREQNLTRQLDEATRALDQVRGEYEELKQGSANYLKFKEEFDRTRADLEAAEKNLQQLGSENKSLKYSQNIKWFAAGALVPLAGWVVGIVMGRRRNRRYPGMYH